jgi:uncharacterized caspase-like protein
METNVSRTGLPGALLTVVCLLLCLPRLLPAQTEPARLALVVGNSAYEGGLWQPLTNPSHDAQAMAQSLSHVGFTLVGCGARGVCLDLTHEGMELAIKEFGIQLREHRGAIAFVYYSGHAVQGRRGTQDADENFLIPVRSGLTEDFELASKAVPVQEILNTLRGVGAGAGVVVLDACRDRALGTAGKGADDSGLASTEAGGMLIAYAAEPGQKALDSLPGNSSSLSPYANRLSQALLTRGMSITDVFLEVRAQVEADTGGRQKPDTVVRLTRNITLVPDTPAPAG